MKNKNKKILFKMMKKIQKNRIYYKKINRNNSNMKMTIKK